MLFICSDRGIYKGWGYLQWYMWDGEKAKHRARVCRRIGGVLERSKEEGQNRVKGVTPKAEHKTRANRESWRAYLTH